MIDLFSGSGGLSWGLSQHGFEVLAGIDHWTAALKTFKHNHKNARVFDTDIEAPRPPTGQRFDAPAPETQPVDTSPPITTGKTSLADKILELNKLREQGVLTDAEFTALKNELLNG